MISSQLTESQPATHGSDMPEYKFMAERHGDEPGLSHEEAAELSGEVRVLATAYSDAFNRLQVTCRNHKPKNPDGSLSLAGIQLARLMIAGGLKDAEIGQLLGISRPAIHLFRKKISDSRAEEAN